MYVTRKQSEQVIEPIISRCQDLFVEKGMPKHPDRSAVRRASMIYSLLTSTMNTNATGQALEIGAGYGYLIFSLARLLPNFSWFATEHPDRAYVTDRTYLDAFRAEKCTLRLSNLTTEPLPFSDSQFTLVTFAETLEHLPVERLVHVLGEMSRVTKRGGFLIMSSPNQASLENRFALLRGRSILEMPYEKEYAKGTYGHIRLYTAREMIDAMAASGFSISRVALESSHSSYRGLSDRDWRRVLWRTYERLESVVPLMRRLGHTWFLLFQKQT